MSRIIFKLILNKLPLHLCLILYGGLFHAFSDHDMGHSGEEPQSHVLATQPIAT